MKRKIKLKFKVGDIVDYKCKVTGMSGIGKIIKIAKRGTSCSYDLEFYNKIEYYISFSEDELTLNNSFKIKELMGAE